MTSLSILHTPRAPIDFTPVPRRTRHDGWTVQRQQDFIAGIARTGNVTAAAASVGLSWNSAYLLRKAPGGESFAAAWDAAVLRGTEGVRARFIDHALNGVPEPVFRRGRLVGERRKFNKRAMMWLIEKGWRLPLGEPGKGEPGPLDNYGLCRICANERTPPKPRDPSRGRWVTGI